MKSLIRRNEPREETPFVSLQREMNRLFDSFFQGPGLTRFGEWDTELGDYSPKVDVSEGEREIRVTAELPGLDEKDVELSLSHDILTLKGEKKSEKEDKGKNYYRVERSYGAFHRTIQLPAEVVSDKVEATFKKGILTVTLPKTESAQKEVKRISVKKE